MTNHPLQPVFNFLETNSLVSLRETHGVRFHIKGHLVTLAYDQFEAKIANDIANLCRGLVLAREDGTVIDANVAFGKVRLLAFPFTRFFNYGQVNEASFKPVAIYEKVDGSLAIVYHDSFNDVWNVATRNVPDGSNTADNATHSFRELFEKAIKDSYNLDWNEFVSTKLRKGYTYIFELMTPENIVVVRHDTYKAVLIGVRNNKLGTEYRAEVVASQIGLQYPTCYTSLVQNFVNFDHLVWLANQRDPLKNEGYVVLGPNFERIKIKSEKYVTFNKVHDLTKYDIINYLLTGEIDDYIPLMQDYQKVMVAELSDKIANWAHDTNHEFNSLAKLSFSSKKELAFHLDTNKILKRHSASIFRNFNLDTENVKVLEVQNLIKDQFLDKNTGRYTDSFLRTIMKEWLV